MTLPGFMYPASVLLVLLTAVPPGSFAQMQDMHHHGVQDTSMAGMDHNTHMMMSGIILLTDPMGRDGSGTSWLPDNSPHHAFHVTFGGWDAMFHGSVFLRYTAQDAFKDGSRGGSTFDAPNWFMGMISHRLGSTSQIGFRTMLSLDRVTEGGAGYPLLFQTGESWNGHRLVDTQHPHDLFMELATAYSISLGEQSTIGLYLGYPGEPALGPPAFMHRPSAWDLPDAPIGHHWQDATHISFGVATLGWQLHRVKIEGSIFTGREPDENRYNFDKPLFDSYAARVSVNPTDEWAFQVSRGFLKSPEALEPGVDQFRTTASIVFQHGTGEGSFWASTLVWGMNTPPGGRSQNSFLLDSDVTLGRQAIFGRIEAVEKSAAELDLSVNPDDIFAVSAFTLGTTRTLLEGSSGALALGVQGTVYAVDPALRSLYGSSPVSLELFFRLSPPMIQMHEQ